MTPNVRLINRQKSKHELEPNLIRFDYVFVTRIFFCVRGMCPIDLHPLTKKEMSHEGYVCEDLHPKKADMGIKLFG